MKSIVILISGRGSNMEAILNAKLQNELPLDIKAVISNRPEAKGLEVAADKGVPAIALDHKAFVSRDEFDAALAKTIDGLAPDYIVLAGFMRVLTPTFVDHYPNRIINIHPSLLPLFPGIHTHQQALDTGVKQHGCTIHFVTADLDHGPIIAQASVPVIEGDNEETLAARVLVEEHKLFPLALRWLAEGLVDVSPTGVVRVAGRDVVSASLPF